MTVQEEIDIKGHQESQKNQLPPKEEISKSYVPLRGASRNTHLMEGLNMTDQQSLINGANSTQSAGSVYSLTQQHARKS